MMNELQRLLRWAKRHKLFIEIFTDGSVEIEQMDSDDAFHRLASGPTLLAALRRARKALERGT